MKTFFKIIAWIIGIPASIILIFAIVGFLVFRFALCPPQGPWPMPPWCKGEITTITIDNAIVVPTDISKINYPQFYKQIKPASADVVNAYCLIDSETVAYPASYLGNYELPKVRGSLPIDIKRAVGLKDIEWITTSNIVNPNFNENCPTKGNLTLDSFDKTLKRVKALGAQEIHITNYIGLTDFDSVTFDYKRKAIGDDLLPIITKKANENGLDVVLYFNLYVRVPRGEQFIYKDPPSSSWLAKFIDNGKPFFLEQAKIAQKTGIKGIMINNFDYQPSIKGYEKVYQENMLNLLEEMRKIYSGKVILLTEPFNGADLNKIDTLLNQVDAYIYTVGFPGLANSGDKTVSVDNFKRLYLKEFERVGENYKKYNKPIYIRVLIQSEKDSLTRGWIEDGFCIKRENNPCYQKDLTVDFSAQAIAYEALMEALKESHKKYFTVEGVDSYGYWFTDVILPDSSQPQIAQSVRNKPAESIIKEWFKK